MPIVQCLLRSGKNSMFCWLRQETRLKPGAIIEIESSGLVWTVETVSHPHEMHMVLDFHESLL